MANPRNLRASERDRDRDVAPLAVAAEYRPQIAE